VRKILLLGIIIFIVTGFVYIRSLNNQMPSFNSPQSSKPTQVVPADSFATTVIAENLDTPWGIAFLPDGSILITERPGRIRLIDVSGVLKPTPVVTLKEAKEIGEGGLLGITLHPNFSSNKYVYLYYTYAANDDQTLNRVVRMTFQDQRMENEQVIVDKIPGAFNHNGGRIKFGPDGFLYVTTGDAEEPSQAQDLNSLAGKILRVTDEGKPALGNPFKTKIYSYGHRNPQGLVWDKRNRLWATEHGRSGTKSGLDELNLVESGKNYGWPTIQGDEQKLGMEASRLNSGSDTWAPAGAAFVGESVFFGGLRGQALYEAIIQEDKIIIKEHFKKELGRIRDVVLGPDGYIYISTSNRDGRGKVNEGDDKILKINIQKLSD